MSQNNPMQRAELLLQEGPRNDKEKEIFLMLEDSYAKGDVAATQRYLEMLPQGM